MINLEYLSTYSTRMEAEGIKRLLEDNGIPCFLQFAETGDVMGGVGANNGPTGDLRCAETSPRSAGDRGRGKERLKPPIKKMAPELVCPGLFLFNECAEAYQAKRRSHGGRTLPGTRTGVVPAGGRRRDPRRWKNFLPKHSTSKPPGFRTRRPPRRKNKNLAVFLLTSPPLLAAVTSSSNTGIGILIFSKTVLLLWKNIKHSPQERDQKKPPGITRRPVLSSLHIPPPPHPNILKMRSISFFSASERGC